MSRLEDLHRDHKRLLQLAVDVDQRIAAIEAAILIYEPKPGRRRIPLTMTIERARELHARYRAGERTPEVIQGHREYNRHWARSRRRAS